MGYSGSKRALKPLNDARFLGKKSRAYANKGVYTRMN